MQSGDETKMKSAQVSVRSLVGMFVQAILSNDSIMRYKHNLCVILQKYLMSYQALDLSPMQQDSYLLLSELCVFIKNGLVTTDHFETLQGAL